MNSNCECCICLEVVETSKNMIITECGHTYHSSCLLKNAAINGFGCPYCRTQLAEEPEDDESEYSEYSEYYSEDDDDEDDEQEEQTEEDQGLTGLRRLFRRVEQDLEDAEDEEAYFESYSATKEEVINHLHNKGYTMEKLVELFMYEMNWRWEGEMTINNRVEDVIDLINNFNDERRRRHQIQA